MATAPTWLNNVAEVFDRYRIPRRVWLAIMFAESGGNPSRTNIRAPGANGPDDPGEQSIGLFQLNRAGGQGAGHSLSDLLDPATNAEIAARHIAPALKVCGASDISCIARKSGHPGDYGSKPASNAVVKKAVAAISRLYDKITGQGDLASSWEEAATANGGVNDDSPTVDVQNLGMLDGGAIASGLTEGLKSFFINLVVNPNALFGTVGVILVGLGLVGISQQGIQKTQELSGPGATGAAKTAGAISLEALLAGLTGGGSAGVRAARVAAGASDAAQRRSREAIRQRTGQRASQGAARPARSESTPNASGGPIIQSPPDKVRLGVRIARRGRRAQGLQAVRA